MAKLLSLRTLLAAALALTGACAPVGTPGASAAERAPRRASDRLTIEEIRVTSFPNALEVVQRLRPRWLLGRGPDSIMDSTPVLVYLDNVRMGGPETMSSIPASSVLSMQFLDAGAATTRWGTGHTSGAILVLTR